MNSNFSVVIKTLTENPRLALQAAYGYVRIQKARYIDYWFKNGKSSELILVTLKITPLCNLACKMCGQRGLKGTLKGDIAIAEAKKIIPAEEYKKLADQVAGSVSAFYVWGGEPFLYPGFMDLASYLAEKIPAFTVNTNGTFLAENAERIVRDRWHGIFISLDGFEETNDEIRGKGSYRRVMAGITALNDEKKKQKSNLPHIGIVSTISNMNYMLLDQLAAAMKGRGLSWHIINLGTYVTEPIGLEHQAFMKKHFGVDATYWKGFATGLNEGIDGDAFAEILKKVYACKNGYPIITVPVIRSKKINMFYADLFKIVRYRCTAPWFSADINYNGDVNFCADYKDCIIGNITQQPIREIFNNERAVKFRRELKHAPHGMFPACKRCYQMNLWGSRRCGV